MAWTEPATATPGELITAAWLNTYIRDNLNALFPVGAFMLRAANYATVETAVEGRWLQCNGAAVSRTTYVELFNLLNALSPTLPFGAGNGTTTFNLPDLRGRSPWAEGERAGVDDIGDSDGVTIDLRGPDHYHTLPAGGGGTGRPVATQSAGTYDQVWYTSTGTFSPDTWTPGNIQDKPAYLVVGSWFIKYH